MNWITWISTLQQLRPAFSRVKTFYWFLLASMGLSMRSDLLGVSSIMRALGLNEDKAYYSFLRLFHSTGVNLHLLTVLWIKICFKIFSPFFVVCRGRSIILVDGIKISKEGRRMPGVKKLFQNSSNNSRAPYIWGHSCQGLSLLVCAGISFLAITLVQRIQEGVDNSKKSIVQTVIWLIDMLPITNLLLIGDAYYFSGKLCKDLKKRGIHLISRARNNAVAYRPMENLSNRRRGRPKVYGNKVQIKHLFQGGGFVEVRVDLYGKKKRVKIKEVNLISKSHKGLIKYILVLNGPKQKTILITTDLTLSAKEIVELYGKRFKIEVSFKEMVHRIGTFSYRFLSTTINKIRKSKKRDPKKESDYHLYIQLGVIIHGMINYLALINGKSIWSKFNGWLRTINQNMISSEQVVMMDLREEAFDFSNSFKIDENFIKFYKKSVLEGDKLRYRECG